MDSEFNANKVKEIFDVSENQHFDAVEYYKVPEVSNKVKENISVEEQLDSTNGNNRINQYEDNNSYDRLNQNNTNDQDVRAQNQAQDKYQINQGGSENAQVTGAESSASTTTAATTTTAAATTATGSAVVASSASLAGVTILAAAAVVAVGAQPSIALADPIIDKQTAKIETGTDYLVYDFDIKGLTSGVTYYIDVYDITGKRIDSYPVTSGGHIRHIASGLNPNTPYDVKFLTKDSTLTDIIYYTSRCTTSFDTSPKAIFNFLPKIDYESGSYNLNCEIYISDYKNMLVDSYIEMYVNEQTIHPEFVYEDNYYKAVLPNLRDEAVISSVAYGYFEEAVNPEIIGTYDYKISYPKNFVSNDNRIFATYEFDADNFSYEYVEDEGNLLNIYTGFDNSIDPRDLYRITLINNLNGKEIIDFTSTDESVQYTLAPMYDDITVRMTLLKEVEPQAPYVEFDSEEIKYQLPNQFVTDFNLSYNEDGISFRGSRSLDIADAVASVKVYTNDGEELSQEVALSMVDDNAFENSIPLYEFDVELDQIKYVSVTIENNGVGYGYFETCEFDVSSEQYDILDDGSINLSYDIALPENATFKSAFVQPLNCQVSESAYDIGQEGTINVLNLYSSDLMINVFVTYEINGVQYTACRKLTKAFDVDIDLDWFGLYASSGIHGVQRVNSTIDGKAVNNQFEVIVKEWDPFNDDYKESDIVSSSDAQVGNFYGATFDENDPNKGTIEYSIKVSETNIVKGTMEYDPSELTGENFEAKKYLKYTINGNNVETTSSFTPNYFKLYNSDGTYDLYVSTGVEFTDSTFDMFSQIFIVTENAGGINTIVSDEYKTDTIILRNLNYEDCAFFFNVGFKDSKGTRWFPKDMFELKEASTNNILEADSDSVTVNAGPQTTVDFKTQDMFKGDEVTLIVNGNSYPIELIRDYQDSRVVDMTDEDTYAYIINYTGYSVQVNVENDYNGYRTFMFSVQIDGIEAKEAKLSYIYSPTYLLENMTGVDASSLEEEKTLDIATYGATIETEYITVTYEDSTTYLIDGLSFNFEDNRDYYIIIAEWNDLVEETGITSFAAETTYYTLSPVTSFVAGRTYYHYVVDHYVAYVATEDQDSVLDYYEAIEVKKYEPLESDKTYYSHVVGKTGVLRSDGNATISISAIASADENIMLYAVELKQKGWYEYNAYDKIEIKKLTE